MSDATYERLARAFAFWIVVVGIACCVVASAGCKLDGRDEAHRLETNGGLQWRTCKTLANDRGPIGSACVSTDGLTLAVCDEDGCLLFQPTAALEQPR